MNENLTKILYPKSQIGKWLPVFLWMGVIFYFSSLPQQTTSQVFIVDFLIKKTAHLSEYAILNFLFFRATGKLTIAFVLSIVYAITDELHQSFVPGRTARLYDIIGFDLVGTSISSYVIWKSKQLRHKKP